MKKVTIFTCLSLVLAFQNNINYCMQGINDILGKPTITKTFDKQIIGLPKWLDEEYKSYGG